MAAILLLSGCAYVGEPLPPLANVPARVDDLTAVQRAGLIIVQFTIPRLTTEGMAIKRELTFDLRIGPAGEPFDENAWAARALRFEPKTLGESRARYEIPAADFVNREVVIAVKTIGANGKDAGWSNFAVVPVLPEPERPRNVRAESVPGGVRLTWVAKGPAFRVFRRDTEEAPFAVVATADRNEYIDTSAEPGKTYDYRVQTAVKIGRTESESEVSDEVRITPEDKFAPAVPKGLGVFASPASLDLTWEANVEPDLAAYRIYRAGPGEDFTRIGENEGVPSYSDRKVEAGKTYRYAVTAVDRAGNESGRSAVVEGRIGN